MDASLYYHIPQESKERGYLSEDELKILMKQKFINPGLEIVRDIFVFACPTDMSLESVSKILGHTKITTTQIYAKITTEKIGRDMDLLSEKLEKLRVV